MSGAVLTFADLTGVMARYHEALVAHETIINQLNVFPVPDGDTGTNMRSTIDAVLVALRESPATREGIAHAISHASLLGARGNSGILLAQFLRAMTSSLNGHDQSGHEQISPAAFSRALREASEAARAAVSLPCEGTLLSVADGGADGAERAVARGEDSLEVAISSYEGARDALWDTPSQLPILARAGVVDAGGAGLMLLYGAFVKHISPESPSGGLELPDNVKDTLVHNPSIDVAKEHSGHDARTSYEVMFLLDADADAVFAFRNAWAVLGDSIAIVGDEPTWSCHIHTRDIGAAIEAAIAIGRPYQIRVTDLDRQVAEENWVERLLTTGNISVITRPDDSEAPTCAVLAVSNGAGLDKILKSVGVGVIVDGGPMMNPSTQELLVGIELIHANEIVLLPNNIKVIAVAQEAARLSGRCVEVLETTNIPEAIAVMLRFDPKARAESNAEAMGVSLRRVKTGEVARATRNATTEVGAVARGDYLAMHNLGVVAVGSKIGEVTLELVKAILLDEHEVVTLYRGSGVDTSQVETITGELSRAYPNLVVEHFDGGQRHEQILVALE